MNQAIIRTSKIHNKPKCQGYSSWLFDKMRQGTPLDPAFTAPFKDFLVQEVLHQVSSCLPVVSQCWPAQKACIWFGPLPHVELHWLHIHALAEYNIEDIDVLVQDHLNFVWERVEVADLLINLFISLLKVEKNTSCPFFSFLPHLYLF